MQIEIVRGGEESCHQTHTELDIDKGRILVVDDESSVTDALRIILEDDGHEVTVALTGLEGLKFLKQRCFDVVVSDVRLPDITGLEVLDAARRICQCCVVILITSDCSTKLVDEARVCGAFDVLQKPFHSFDMQRLITMALRKQ
jgi:DNA-binding NtrC family response regulator